VPKVLEVLESFSKTSKIGFSYENYSVETYLAKAIVSLPQERF
jgi:hypothetical protein